jgi:hypothetical protein
MTGRSRPPRRFVLSCDKVHFNTYMARLQGFDLTRGGRGGTAARTTAAGSTKTR